MTNEILETENDTDTQSLDDQWGEALSEQITVEEKAVEAAPRADEAPEPAVQQKPREARKIEARPASFGTLTEEKAGAVGNLNMVLDIPITISVEIGRTRMMVKDLLQLGQGTVVELDKLAGEPMEILVNGRLIAMGEAVVVNEKFGIKLTDIVSPSERINRLK